MARKILVVLFLSIFLISWSPVQKKPVIRGKEVAGVASSLTVERAEVGAEDPITLRFSLTNTTDKPLNVLKWHTPLEGFTSDMFQVMLNGKRVKYIGRLVKRGAPRSEDYVAVPPGTTVSVPVDLAEAYAIYDIGDYNVSFKSELFDIGQEAVGDLTRKAKKEMFKPKRISSNNVSFKLVEQKSPPSFTPKISGGDVEAKQPDFSDCTQTQKDTLNEALMEAVKLCDLMLSTLNGIPSGKRDDAPCYTSWFGGYDSSRWNTVVTNLEKILDALENKSITFNCDCNEDYFAYVYPHKPYEIFLCNQFWMAPLVGTDSKAGTIVHELSHFNIVAGTDDHVYGQSNCRSLARSNPELAVGNADSYEYCVENTPKSCGSNMIFLSLLAVFLVIMKAATFRKRRGRVV